MRTQTVLRGLAVVGGVTLGAAGVAKADYASTILADSPTAYFHYDEGANSSTAANSALGHSGDGVTYQNAAKVSTGQAGAFAGSGNSVTYVPDQTLAASVTQTDAGALSQTYGSAALMPYNYTNNFTIEAWVNKVPIDGKEDTSRFIYASNYAFGINGNNNFHLAVFGKKDYVLTSATITPNVWNYIAVTFALDGSNNSTVNFYVNGANVGTLTGTPAENPPSAVALFFGLGRRSGGASGWNGGIDEFAMYNTTLSDGQIATHYAAAVPEPASLGLIGLGALGLLRRRK